MGVVLFGSSVYEVNPHDIDIAIITMPGRFDDFTDFVLGNTSLSKYDISLIAAEELRYPKFYFGGHGQHLVESLRGGIALIGKNPFGTFPPVSIQDVRLSVFDRMKEYVYILRKGYFDTAALSKFFSRYEKMLKLAVFLIVRDSVFPDVLRMTVEEAQACLIEHGCVVTEQKQRTIEHLWIRINELYS